jgi:hypothetical protein
MAGWANFDSAVGIAATRVAPANELLIGRGCRIRNRRSMTETVFELTGEEKNIARAILMKAIDAGAQVNRADHAD